MADDDVFEAINEAGKAMEIQEKLCDVTGAKMEIAFDVQTIAALGEHCVQWFCSNDVFYHIVRAYEKLCGCPSGQEYLGQRRMVTITAQEGGSHSKRVHTDITLTSDEAVTITVTLFLGHRVGTYNDEQFVKAWEQAIPLIPVDAAIDKVKEADKCTEIKEKLEDLTESKITVSFDFNSIRDLGGERAEHAAQWFASNDVYYHVVRAYEKICQCASGVQYLAAFKTVRLVAEEGGTNSKKVTSRVSMSEDGSGVVITCILFLKHRVGTYNDDQLCQAFHELVPFMSLDAALDEVKEAGKAAEIEEKLQNVLDDAAPDPVKVTFDLDSVRILGPSERAVNAAKWFCSNDVYYHIVRAYEKICNNRSGQVYLGRYPNVLLRCEEGGSNSKRVTSRVEMFDEGHRIVFTCILFCEHRIGTYNDDQLVKELEGAMPMIKIDSALDQVVEAAKQKEIQEKLRDVVELESLTVEFDLNSIRALGGERAEHAAQWFKSNDVYYHVVRAYEKICNSRSGKVYLSGFPRIVIRCEHGGNNSHKVTSRLDLSQPQMMILTAVLFTDHRIGTYNDDQLVKELEQLMPNLRVDKDLDAVVEADKKTEIKDKLNDIVEPNMMIVVEFDLNSIRALGGDRAEHAAQWFKSNDVYYHVVRAYEKICSNRSGKNYLGAFTSVTLVCEYGGSNSNRVSSRLALEGSQATIYCILHADNRIGTYNDDQLVKEFERMIPFLRVDAAIDSVVNADKAREIQEKLVDVLESEQIQVSFDLNTIRQLGGERAEHAAQWFSENNVYYHIVRAYEKIGSCRSGKAYLSQTPRITVACELGGSNSSRVSSRLIIDPQNGTLVIMCILHAESRIGTYNDDQLVKEFERAIPMLKVDAALDAFLDAGKTTEIQEKLSESMELETSMTVDVNSIRNLGGERAVHAAQWFSSNDFYYHFVRAYEKLSGDDRGRSIIRAHPQIRVSAEFGGDSSNRVSSRATMEPNSQVLSVAVILFCENRVGTYNDDQLVSVIRPPTQLQQAERRMEEATPLLGAALAAEQGVERNNNNNALCPCCDMQ